MLKKILKISALVLISLIALAFLLPIVFKGKILAIARTEINKTVNAKVDFEDVDISLFRHFPRLAVGVENLQVTGTDIFEKDTLIAAKRFDLSLNLMSLFGGSTMTIYDITLDEPRIHLIVNKQGASNWNITKPSSVSDVTPGEKGPEFHLNLQSYSIKNGYISYQDIPGAMSSEIIALNHQGQGDFSSDLFTLKTKTTTASASFTYAGIPYLLNTKTELGADIVVDNKANKYSFKTDDIQINDLKLTSDGFFQIVNDTTYGMDIRFSAPSTEFRTLLSLVPAIYKNDFNKIKTSGQAAFNGFVKGEYNSKNIPAYQVNLSVENGFFQYPDLPQPVKNIAIKMKVDNPDGITDHTVIDISKGHIEFGNDPFEFRLFLKNPMSDQYIDATLKGRLNLAQVTQFMKLTGDTKLSGILDADISAKGNASAVTKQKPGLFTANGFVNVSSLNYSSKDFPQPLRNGNIQVNFQNPDGIADHTVINIPVAHLELGSEPIDFSLLLKTPVSNPAFEGKVTGTFNLANAAQFTAFELGTNLSGTLSAALQFKGSKSAIDQKAYDQINSSGTLSLKKLNFINKDYPSGVQVNVAEFSFNPKNITLSGLEALYLGTHYTASGSLDNAIGYALKNESISGNIRLHADQLDLNKLMGNAMNSTDTNVAKANPSTNPFLVPAQLAFTISATIDQLIYDKVNYQNVNGTIAIKDEAVTMTNLQMDAFNGKIAANGFYSTRNNKKQPDISFSYDLHGLDVQKTFLAFNTVQRLMPVGKYVSGKINSQFSVAGKLGGDMTPIINTLTGKGNLLFVEGALEKFAPAEKIAQALNIKELNGLSLKDVKIFFEFANGKVLIRPFHTKVNSIDMEIGGMHGLDETIDYTVAMKLPRTMLGSQGNDLVNGLAQQASSKGIPVKLSDEINLNLKIGGTLTNPTIKTDLKSAGTDMAADLKKQADIFAKQATDSVKTVLNEKADVLKDSAKVIKQQAIKDLSADLAKSLTGKKDSTNSSGNALENTQKNAEKTVTNTINSLFNKKKKSGESQNTK